MAGRRTVLSLIWLPALWSFGTGGVISSGQANRDPEVVFQDEEEALANDMAEIAAARGWSDLQVQAYMVAEEAVGRAAERLELERPEQFVGSAIPDDPMRRPILFVKGPADDYVADLVAAAPIELEVRDLQPYSFSELRARMTTINEALADAGYQHTATMFDLYEEGFIRVEVVRSESSGTSDTDIRVAIPAEIREK